MTDRDTPYRFSLVMPVDLEKKARKRAYEMGMIKGGKGMLNGYIKLLIHEDLNARPPLDMNSIAYVGSSHTNMVNLTLDREIKELALERAKDLGFMYGGKGNLSMYIRYLIVVC